jgi:hypothetical protein
VGATNPLMLTIHYVNRAELYEADRRAGGTVPEVDPDLAHAVELAKQALVPATRRTPHWP